ncbi:hypothetical protein G7K_0856-t1 [Saitoella complicata NRRL Y-17804]|uniref:Uncharacterized protein n=1 Tax=Saitoella complicata (strain BCRC 22490 / CBS 7301 / JCM 7358 / NBRC 10748 / NRRL Y-17804) TaxID=698492 RepID=A0A0E9N9X5_SAICN|nr:hypothetical protein G7K_0856-t1 [Saitoella complicata NRRL Y-17804]
MGYGHPPDASHSSECRRFRGRYDLEVHDALKEGRTPRPPAADVAYIIDRKGKRGCPPETKQTIREPLPPVTQSSRTPAGGARHRVIRLVGNSAQPEKRLKTATARRLGRIVGDLLPVNEEEDMHGHARPYSPHFVNADGKNTTRQSSLTRPEAIKMKVRGKKQPGDKALRTSGASNRCKFNHSVDLEFDYDHSERDFGNEDNEEYRVDCGIGYP